jgi:hypothetical protein
VKHRYGVVKLLAALPPDFPLPIAVVQHRTGNPPNLLLIVRADESLALFDGHKIRHVHSSANPLFASAAPVYGERGGLGEIAPEILRLARLH